MPPYRSVGPVTVEEYESRAERYDKQIRDEMGIDPAGMTVAEKIALQRGYRWSRYQTLVDTVYKRRGWTKNGVPTVEKLKDLGIAFPDVIEVVKAHGA